jgi:prevent-host-death family protein
MYSYGQMWYEVNVHCAFPKESSMSQFPIPTETFKFTEARPQLSELLNRVYRRDARIVIKKGEIPVGALVSMLDLEKLEKWDEEWEKGFEILDEIGVAFKGVPPEEIEREAAKALAEVRAEARAERERAVNE